MPKGPKGEKRPADVIGAAVKVMKTACPIPAFIMGDHQIDVSSAANLCYD